MRKHLFFILGLALTVIFFAVSCTEPEPEVPNASVHVYAAGSYLSDFGPAVLWKNGTVTKLKDCSHPKDIYIHSGDYYIAGYNRVDDMQEKPVVLKNDEHLTINTLWGGCCFSVFVK